MFPNGINDLTRSWIIIFVQILNCLALTVNCNRAFLSENDLSHYHCDQTKLNICLPSFARVSEDRFFRMRMNTFSVLVVGFVSLFLTRPVTISKQLKKFVIVISEELLSISFGLSVSSQYFSMELNRVVVSEVVNDRSEANHLNDIMYIGETCVLSKEYSNQGLNMAAVKFKHFSQMLLFKVAR